MERYEKGDCMLDRKEQMAIVEGLLFVAGDEGVYPEQIAKVLEIEVKDVIQIIEEMQRECEGVQRGCKLYNLQKCIALPQKRTCALLSKINGYTNSSVSFPGCS